MPQGGDLKIKTANQYLDKPIYGYDEVREGDYVVLSVTDTGEGIPAKDLQRIFEPFYTKKVMGRSGTGLGLAVIWGTMKDHQGYINVQSAEGKGSTFTLYFPVTREDISVEAASISVSEYMGKGETILVVDDDESSRNLLAMLLADAGFKVVTAKSGNDAWHLLNGHAIHLVITDQFMPDGDGWSVLKDWSARKIPIILLSAAPPDRPKNLSESLRFADIQLKPLDVNSLLNAIGKILPIEWAATESHDMEENIVQHPPMELLAPIKAMIELGAVTDIAEWLEDFSIQYPQYAPYVSNIAAANLALDFKALRKLIK